MYKQGTLVRIVGMPENSEMFGVTGTVVGVSPTPDPEMVGYGAYLILLDEEHRQAIANILGENYSTIAMVDSCVEQI